MRRSRGAQEYPNAAHRTLIQIKTGVNRLIGAAKRCRCGQNKPAIPPPLPQRDDWDQVFGTIRRCVPKAKNGLLLKPDAGSSSATPATPPATPHRETHD